MKTITIFGKKAHAIAVREFRRVPLHERGGIIGEAAIHAWEEAKARAVYETTEELLIDWEPEQESYESVYGMPPESDEYYSVLIRRASDNTVMASIGFVDSGPETVYGRMVENDLLREVLTA